jgi:preprotein translocase subunit YajC
MPPVFPSVAPLVIVVAQAAAEGPPDFVRTVLNALPLAMIALAAYLLLFRPERERVRRQQELLGGLKKNDRVLTSAGIYGTVAAVDRTADRITLKVDETANVKIDVTLASIAKVIVDKAGGTAAGEAAGGS